MKETENTEKKEEELTPSETPPSATPTPTQSKGVNEASQDVYDPKVSGYPLHLVTYSATGNLNIDIVLRYCRLAEFCPERKMSPKKSLKRETPFERHLTLSVSCESMHTTYNP